MSGTDISYDEPEAIVGQPLDPGQPGQPGPYSPGPYPPGTFPPGNQPQGSYRGAYPQGPYPPGAHPGAAYGQGGYPPPPPPPKDRSGMRRWGKILTFVGLIVLVVTVAVGAVLAVSGIGKIVDEVDQALIVEPTASRTYDAGDTFALFTEDGRAPSCDISGPGDLKRLTGTSTEFTHEGRHVESFDAFEVVQGGTYTFECTDRVVVASLDLGSIFSGVGGVLLAVFGGGLGFLVLLVGVVLWILAGRKPRTA